MFPRVFNFSFNRVVREVNEKATEKGIELRDERDK